MTRCVDFYEKLIRDGNFCGMSEQSYRRAVRYIDFCKEQGIELGSISQREWLDAQKKDIEKSGDTKVSELKGEESIDVLGVLNPDYIKPEIKELAQKTRLLAEKKRNEQEKYDKEVMGLFEEADNILDRLVEILELGEGNEHILYIRGKVRDL